MVMGLRESVRERYAVLGLDQEIAYHNGLLLETSGPQDEVVKLLPPLTISHDDLVFGLSVLSDAVYEVVAQ